MRILIASGFFESSLSSYREYAYSKQLRNLGHDVSLLCGDQSQIWKHSRIKLPPTDPTAADAAFVRETGVRLLRRHVFFRYSDFVLYWPVLSAIREADVVHVVEFRQGVTLLIALLAKLFGKPVVYDHEQRGDRDARWYSRVDSIFRRALIRLGSLTVSCMRHTVLANRDHYRRCALRRTREMFAPLGVDTQRFYFDPVEREKTRAELGLSATEKVAVISGKLTNMKKVGDVISACRNAGYRLILVGTIAEDLTETIAAMPAGTEILLGQADAGRLRAIFAAADVVIFTTFTVSYWEAYATGLPLIVPASDFTRFVFDGDAAAILFGSPDWFAVPDEQYRDGVDLTPPITAALQGLQLRPRVSRTNFSSQEQVRKLATVYEELTAAAQRSSCVDG